MIVENEDFPNHNRVTKRTTEPLGLRQNIRFGDEIANVTAGETFCESMLD